jgi:hypothetical protein
MWAAGTRSAIQPAIYATAAVAQQAASASEPWLDGAVGRQDPRIEGERQGKSAKSNPTAPRPRRYRDGPSPWWEGRRTGEPSQSRSLGNFGQKIKGLRENLKSNPMLCRTA